MARKVAMIGRKWHQRQFLFVIYIFTNRRMLILLQPSQLLLNFHTKNIVMLVNTSGSNWRLSELHVLLLYNRIKA